MATICKNHFIAFCAGVCRLARPALSWQVALLQVAVLVAPQVADAYLRTRSNSGFNLYWQNAHIDLKANVSNSSGLNEATAENLLRQSLNRWTASGANISYAFSNSAANETSAKYDSTNRLFFASNSSAVLSPGVIAVTQVTYFVADGKIAETDLIFNDNDYLFTSTLGDTGLPSGSKTKVYLPDVATHEFGHAYGFDHSNLNLSTMLYSAFSGQENLSNDDITAINTVYPRSTAGKGSISGVVRGQNGGMFGTHVVAIRLDTGETQAATLANSDGSFLITDLPAAQYVVYTEAFRTSTATISGYWERMNHRFCGGQYFKTTFYSGCGPTNGLATTVGVQSGQDTSLGTVAPSCNSISNPTGAPASQGSARDVAANGGAHFGKMNAGETHYYKLTGFSGDLDVKAASYTMYSPIDVSVTITDAFGNVVGSAQANVADPLPGGFVNYDSRATATALPAGDYYVRVTSPASLSSFRYPAGFDLKKSTGFYLVMVTANGSTGTSGTSDMSSCLDVANTEQSALITEYSIDSSDTGSIEQNGSDGDGGSGCGTIDPDDQPPFYNNSVFVILILTLLGRLLAANGLAPQRRRR